MMLRTTREREVERLVDVAKKKERVGYVILSGAREGASELSSRP